MIAILTTVLGFFGPFLPQVLKYFQQKSDNAHELKVMELQATIAEKQQQWKMEEINTQADISESAALRTPTQSFGVQVLDAAKSQDMNAWLWVPVFWAFSFLDWAAGMVRPVITYTVVGFWLAYKVALIQLAQRGGDVSLANSLVMNWSENDWAVLLLVLGYWFGQRAMKAVFGGTASTGKPGGG